ncbi:MAG: MFS transporter [bacterium]|nr:MFS transporter [candidate division KSB1 bacterium]MDH7559008.1 MFS transporter [bacterium]
MRISVIEGSWATVHIVMTTNAFLTGYALFLGANDLQLSLVTSVPLLMQLFQIFGARLVERTGQRKKICAWGSFTGRLMWLPIALLPLLHRGDVIVPFLALYGFGTLLQNLSAPAWLTWMGDLVPKQIRGRYFGWRNRVVGIVTMGTSIIAGLILDLAKEHGREYDGFLAVQLISVVAAAVAFHYIRQQPEPPYRAEKTPPLGEYVARPLRDRSYRRILAFYLYWLFAVGISTPFFAAHLLKNLGWNFKAIAYLNIVTAAMTILPQLLWGRLIDRFGHKSVLTVCEVAILHLPLYYAFCPPGVSWPIWVNAVLAGVFWSGFNLAIFSLVLAALPAKGRPGYMAAYSAWSGVMNFVAITLGGWIALRLSGLQFHLAGLPFGNYQVLFTLTSVLRFPGLFLLHRVREKEAVPTAILVRQTFNEVTRRIGLGRHFFLLPHANGRRGGQGSSGSRIRR